MSTSRSFVQRLWGAARLEAETFEEVEADRGANLQAIGAVVLASTAAGIGSLENNGWVGIPAITGVALAAWWLWAAVTLFVGTKLLPGPETVADMGELLRTLGFAAAPGILLVLALVPPIAWLVYPACAAWMLASMVIGVRQALDYEGRGATFRALAVCAIGFPIYMVAIAVALLALGPWPV